MAWSDISKNTIANCFKHFLKDNIDNIQIPDDISINKKSIENSIIKIGIFDGIPVDDYLDMFYTENDEIIVHLESVVINNSI